MSNVTFQIDDNGNAAPQTQTGQAGAADVNVVGGAVAIDQTNIGVTNAIVNTPSINGQATNNATVAVYVASLVIKASPGKLYGMSGYNSNGLAQFVLIFDASSLPAEGAIPQVVIRVAALSNFAIDYGIYGRPFAHGIVVCNSSTGPTKTIGTTDTWFDAQFL